ncbi:cyclin-dependent kinase inhibitor 1-like [Ylistrum balloti]|uniref:cyclin-dependent kinase inhibitor 1-like n=1 Tax=Ylistrum balloti TaxID=509963 RepID=UPI002905C036|nr:cyclin-dependent kinase inhibitor 1-like [Ylistrum balloti]
MIATKMHAVVQLKENININNSNKKMDVSRVRRCLFGKPDKDSLKAEVSKLYAKDCAEAKSRWNYDILNDVPEDGPLNWVQTTDCPDFYKKGYTSKFRRVIPRVPCNSVFNRDYSDDSDDECNYKRVSSATSDEDNDVLSSHTDLCNKSDEDSKSHSSTIPAKLVQTHMDAYLRKRKRAVPSSTTSSKTRRLE